MQNEKPIGVNIKSEQKNNNNKWYLIKLVLLKANSPKVSRDSFFGLTQILIWVEPLWSIHLTSLQICSFTRSF
jgi:hypothetical protein